MRSDCGPISIDAWRREHPDQVRVEAVRFTDFAVQAGAVAAARALMRGSGDELEARIALEGKHFNERLQSPEAKAAFEAFFSRKR